MIEHWGLLVGLGLGEFGLMAFLGCLFWRHSISHQMQAIRYTLGCLGLLGGFAGWAAATGDTAGLGVLAVLIATAGAGAFVFWGAASWVDEHVARAFRARQGRKRAGL